MKFAGKMPTRANKTRGASLVRTGAVETHMGVSQEPSYAEIYRENAAPQSERFDQAPALTPIP